MGYKLTEATYGIELTKEQMDGIKAAAKVFSDIGYSLQELNGGGYTAALDDGNYSADEILEVAATLEDLSGIGTYHIHQWTGIGGEE